MKITSLTIPLYDWSVTVFSSIKDEQDYQSVTHTCDRYGVPESVTKDLLSNLVDKQNCGNHLCNTDHKLAFIFLAPITSEVDFYSIIPHELDHLATYVCNTHGLETEGRGYLVGYIYKTLYQLGVFNDIATDFYSNQLSPEPFDPTQSIMDTFKACMGGLRSLEKADQRSKLSAEFIKCLTNEFSSDSELLSQVAVDPSATIDAE